jgi:hypothetical protein
LTQENPTWDPETKQTYEELYYYYKAPEFFDPVGYHSKEYFQTYYDGYGLNHYYGNYGYYEYSRAPSPPSTLVWDAGRFAKTLIVMIVVLAVMVFLWIKSSTYNDPNKQKMQKQKTSQMTD